MKTLIGILLSMMLTVSFSISAESQGHEMKDGQDGQMMGENSKENGKEHVH